MKTLALRVTRFACVLLVVTMLLRLGANGSSKVLNNNPLQEHLSGLISNVTFKDGATQIVRINGVGCTESLCSTVLMKAKTETNTVVEIWFDSIAAIRDIRQNDAVFVAKDGSQRRLTFISDFRVLYISSSGRANAKIDLAKIKSLEMTSGGH
jgi:hypothetical protein